MKPRILLLFAPDCPNVEMARVALREALHHEGLPLEWTEQACGNPGLPEPLRDAGSPTVVVDGRDVMPADADDACCRLYPDGEGFRGAPSVEQIRAALASNPSA